MCFSVHLLSDQCKCSQIQIIDRHHLCLHIADMTHKCVADHSCFSSFRAACTNIQHDSCSPIHEHVTCALVLFNESFRKTHNRNSYESFTNPSDISFIDFWINIMYDSLTELQVPCQCIITSIAIRLLLLASRAQQYIYNIFSLYPNFYCLP